jgi:hypothetical protein
VDKEVEEKGEASKWKIYASLIRTISKEEIPVNVQGFLFKEKALIMKGEAVDIEKAFLYWIKTSYTSYTEYWKETNITQLQEYEKIQEKVIIKDNVLSK